MKSFHQSSNHDIDFQPSLMAIGAEKGQMPLQALQPDEEILP